MKNPRHETTGQALAPRLRQAARNLPSLLVPEADAKGIKKFLGIFLLLIISSSSFATTYQRTQILMGDVPVSITVKTSQQHKAYRAMEQAFEEVRRLNSTVSEWHHNSDTTRLNQHPTLWVPIGPDLMKILIKAQEISEMTHGAFDVTWASKNKKISYRDIELIPELNLARLKKKTMRIGISSIAKGYIVDAMVEILRKNGFKNFLINAGDIYASGTWQVSIKCPSPLTSCPSPLTLHNQAISTSGLYERGKHIIDPRTGKTPNFYENTTVIADQAFIASPLATGLFVMSPQEVKSFEREHQMIIDSFTCIYHDK